MKLNAFFSPIAAAFRAAALALSMVDGKPGLSVADFATIMEWTVTLRDSKASNAEKATLVADSIISHFGGKIPPWPWLPFAIGWICHAVAKRLKPPAK